MKIRQHRRRRFARRKPIKTRTQKPLRNNFEGPWQKKLWNIFLRIGLPILGVFVLFLVLYTYFVLPSVSNASQLSFSESTIIYDRGALEPGADPAEHILYKIHGDENRDYIPLREISPWVAQATLAIEDDGFYSHIGFDVGGLAKAVLSEVGIGTPRGGSTITQQLVKNVFLSNERTWSRKFNELLLSLKVEAHYTKDEILELYLNKIPYGSNAHGIEAAANTFFGKSSRELTLAEAAVLASLPAAPTRFSPFGSNRQLLMGYHETDENGNSTYKKGRKDLVLERMLELEMITEEEYKEAFDESNAIEFNKADGNIKAPHFVFYVREMIEAKYGKDFLKNGGLRIYTTIDKDLQEIAEDEIKNMSANYERAFNASNAALTAIDPDNGHILAYVGGRDFFDEENDGQVDVLQSRRQPGSSFKPFAYAAAFDAGYNPASIVFDVQTDFGGNYTPQNYDGTFAGPVSIRQALNASMNIPAIKMTYLAGVENTIDLAKSAGIALDGNAYEHGVALGIGVAEVKPLDHINAYQVFARDGSYFEPMAILEVQNSHGEVLESFNHFDNRKNGIDRGSAEMIRNILTDENSRPITYLEDGETFTWNTFLQIEGIDNGAKTGTSNRIKANPNFNPNEEISSENPKMLTVPGDSWTIGFSPHIVSGVWVGNNSGEPLAGGATGMAVAAPIWRNFMTRAHEELFEKGYDQEKPYPSSILEEQKVNKYSGLIASDKTPEEVTVTEVFAPDRVPQYLDDSIQTIEIDNRTKLPADPTTPSIYKIKVPALTLQSLQPNKPNWENPVQEWMKEHPLFRITLGAVKDPDAEIKDQRALDALEALQRIEAIQLLEQSYMRLDGFPQRTFTGDYRGDLPPELLALEDGMPPTLKVLSPRSEQAVPIGSTLHIFTEATDNESGIKRVDFIFDDGLISSQYQAPYEIFLPIDTTIGEHTISITATDKAGFSSSVDLPIMVTELPLSSGNSDPYIISIEPNINQTTLQIGFPNFKEINWTAIIIEKDGAKLYDYTVKNPGEIVTISLPNAGELKGSTLKIQYYKNQNQAPKEILIPINS